MESNFYILSNCGPQRSEPRLRGHISMAKMYFHGIGDFVVGGMSGATAYVFSS